MALLSINIFADTVATPSNSELKITIYNSNIAYIHEKREVNVTEGKQKLIYEGVPSSVITQSVVPTFLGINTKLYSQNYIYDLISLHSMLKNSIDKSVEFYTNGKEPRLSKGRLLSTSPVMIQEDATKKIYTLDSSTQVIFSEIPKSMITKPSLVWNIESEKSGKLDIDLNYLAKGITWKSDYVLNLKKDTFDITAWITVDNNSGVAYKDANITCLAGKVNRVRANDINILKYLDVKKKRTGSAFASLEVKEESFAGYHIYKIPFKETIKNKEQKQITFFNKKDVKYNQYATASNSRFTKYDIEKFKFTNTIEFKNSKANNMGVPLPEGLIRIYQKDSKNETHFIGEQKIDNIPTDENVTLKIGTLFDVVGEKRVTKYIRHSKYLNMETEYKVRNQGKEPRVLKIKEYMPVYGEKIILTTSCKGECVVNKKSAFVQEFTIKLKPKESYKFTSEFEQSW